MKKAVKLVWLLCIVFGIGIFMARPASADAGFVINEGILQKYTGNAEKVVIPGNVTIIGSAAFDENDTIKEVVMPANLREIQSSAFQGCDNLKKVTMNDKVTKLGQMCFRNCVKLESIVIPESVNFIGSAAFQYCYSLTIRKVPQKVTTIEYGAFSGCSNLTEITVSESNAKYRSEGGVLFDKYESMLVSYPAGKKDATYTVPDGTYAVERQAFWEVTNLTEVILPDSMRTLNIKSFANCRVLSEMHILASVTKIDDGAFEECRALRNVYVMNDRVSFGSDVFKGAPGVELYGRIGSTAEEYAGLMRISFHVIQSDTPPDSEVVQPDTSEESITEATSEEETEEDAEDEPEEDDEKPESSEKGLTRWILFFGIALAACLILLFGILMVMRIGRKREDSEPEMQSDFMEETTGWKPRTGMGQIETIGFGDPEMGDWNSELSGDEDGTWVLGEDGMSGPPKDYGERSGTQAIWDYGGRNKQPGDHGGRSSTQVFGADRNKSYRQEEQGGRWNSWQNGGMDRQPESLMEQSSMRKPQAGDLDGKNETAVYGAQENMNRRQVDPVELNGMRKPQADDLDGKNETEAFGAPKNENRIRGSINARGNEGIARRETPGKTNAGADGKCTCKACGMVNDPAQKYCMRCGAVLTQTERTPYSSSKETDTVFCSHCGAQNKKEDKFCINCGSLL